MRIGFGAFKAWVGNWVLKRWPDIIKEELTGIKVSIRSSRTSGPLAA